MIDCEKTSMKFFFGFDVKSPEFCIHKGVWFYSIFEVLQGLKVIPFQFVGFYGYRMHSNV